MNKGRLSTENRTQATQDMLNEVGNFLDEYEHLNFENIKQSQSIKHSIKKIVRAQREFMANLFFVVVFGPVKSGKSTFVNSLARAYVSPTAYGIECTMRPSLIIQHEETGIDEYFPLSQSANDTDTFHKVIDYLRGMTTEEELSKVVRKKTSPLKKALVDEKLSGYLEQEPVITVIRVPGGRLIRDGIAILDMPGLDGSQSHWTTSPVHKWVIQRSDFLIFIQSSISALNGDTLRFLLEIVKKSRNPPIRIIQNIFEAKHWRSPEEQKKESENQMRQAIKQIRGNLELPNAPPCKAINIGKANDGIFRNNHELLDHSEFEPYENELREILDCERVSIQEINSVNGMPKAFEEALENLGNISGEMEEIDGSYNAKIQAIDDCVSRLNGIDYSLLEYRLLIEKTVSELAAKAMVDWKETVNAKGDRLIRANNKTTAGKVLNQLLKDLAGDMGKYGHSYCFDVYGLFGNKIQRQADEVARKIEGRTLDDINGILETNALPVLPKTGSWPVADIPKVIRTAFEYDRVRERRFGVFVKRYHGAEVKKYINDAREKFEIQIEDRKTDWEKIFKLEFEKYCAGRRAEMQRHLDIQKMEYGKSMEKEIEMVQNTSALTKELQSKLSHLMKLAKEAVSSIKPNIKTGN